jgi:hypothetical protein
VAAVAEVAVVAEVLAPVAEADRPIPAAHQPPQRPPASGTAFASLTGAARWFAVKRYAAAASRSRARTPVTAFCESLIDDLDASRVRPHRADRLAQPLSNPQYISHLQNCPDAEQFLSGQIMHVRRIGKRLGNFPSWSNASIEGLVHRPD